MSEVNKQKTPWFMILSGLVLVGVGVTYMLMFDKKDESSKIQQTTPSSPEIVPSESEVSVIQIAPLNSDGEDDAISMQTKVAAAAKWFKESELGNKEFGKKVGSLGDVGDELSARILIALSDLQRSETAALDTLGSVHNPKVKDDVITFLRKKIKSPHINLGSLMAALGSFARVAGDDVLPEIEEYITNNWKRPDGWGEQVCSAAVGGVAELNTAKSFEMLKKQLQRVDQKSWLHDYGSVVVKALSKHDHPLVKESLLEYAAKLRFKLKSIPNRSAKKYFEKKITEAENLANSNGPSSPTDPSPTQP